MTDTPMPEARLRHDPTTPMRPIVSDLPLAHPTVVEIAAIIHERNRLQAEVQKLRSLPGTELCQLVRHLAAEQTYDESLLGASEWAQRIDRYIKAARLVFPNTHKAEETGRS